MTKIEWCDETVNPLGWGCYGPGGTPKKPAVCPGCYAERWAKKSPWCSCEQCRQFVPHWHPEALDKPLHWKKHRSIFWQDMGDLWHPEVPMPLRLQVLKTTNQLSKHTHIFLTKHPEEYLNPNSFFMLQVNAFYGVTVRTQEEADRLIPELLKFATLGFKVFISYEPALGPINFSLPACQFVGLPAISCIIAGGMTGPDAKPAHPDWFRTVRDQCQTSGVSFFFKGYGEWKAAADPKEGLEFLNQTSGLLKCCQTQGSSLLLYNIGRKASGRSLDGRTHDALPWRVNK